MSVNELMVFNGTKCSDVYLSFSFPFIHTGLDLSFSLGPRF